MAKGLRIAVLALCCAAGHAFTVRAFCWRCRSRARDLSLPQAMCASAGLVPDSVPQAGVCFAIGRGNQFFHTLQRFFIPSAFANTNEHEHKRLLDRDSTGQYGMRRRAIIVQWPSGRRRAALLCLGHVRGRRIVALGLGFRTLGLLLRLLLLGLCAEKVR